MSSRGNDVGEGWAQKRGTLHIHEMTDDLVAFTEHRDRQLEKSAKADQKAQRKAARHLRFGVTGAKPVTLTLIDRRSGQELMKKSYPDGAIDEYPSLGRYQLPPQEIRALVRGPWDEVPADLSPENR